MSQEQLGTALNSLGLQVMVIPRLESEQERRAWQLINELKAIFDNQAKKAS
jgi:hypothetical protein